MLEPKRLMNMGFAFPCSFCTRMFIPEGKEAPRCEMQTCGGPFVGKSFPDYVGPLTKTTIATHCFRCGGEAEEAIVATDGGYVGVCKPHLNSTVPSSVDTLIPSTEKPSDAVLPIGKKKTA